MNRTEYILIRENYAVLLRHRERMERFSKDTYKDVKRSRRFDFFLGGIFYTNALLQATAASSTLEYIFLGCWTAVAIMFLWLGFGRKEIIDYWEKAVEKEVHLREKTENEIHLLDIQYHNDL